MADEIIEELWRVKDEMAREHGYDVRRFADYIRSRDREREAREARAATGGNESESVDGRQARQGGPAPEVYWQPTPYRGSSEDGERAQGRGRTDPGRERRRRSSR